MEYTYSNLHRIAVLSDTHGLLRPEVKEKITGADLILHAGDVGTPFILEELEQIAPAIVVRGNIDRGDWADVLPQTHYVVLNGIAFYLIHNLDHLDLDPVTAEVSYVISGHSHKPKISSQNNVIYLNPGAIGPKRFNLPISYAELHWQNNAWEQRWFRIE